MYFIAQISRAENVKVTTSDEKTQITKYPSPQITVKQRILIFKTAANILGYLAAYCLEKGEPYLHF